MSRAPLTGRTRYRVSWLGRLVLQVEQVRYWESDHGYVPSKSWRDARADDFVPPEQAGLFKRAPIPFPGQRPTTLLPE